MAVSFSRRKFFGALSGVGAGAFLGGKVVFPAIRTSKTQSGPRAKGPFIFCSRGEKWGMKVTEPGYKILGEKNALLDAVERSAQVTELDPEDRSVGYGGIPNENCVVQLDASIMYGPTHNCGSVASLEGIKTPSSVARLVMERTDHIMLVGPGAQQFALRHGFKLENLLTEKSRISWLKWKENLSKKDDWLPPENEEEYQLQRPTGTINVLGVDADHNIAGITTTSGLGYKIPGRIGDSPVIGAGLYVDNEVGAAGATGRGEEVIRTCGSYLVVEEMRRGKSPAEACKIACERIVEVNKRAGTPVNFNDKYVAINKKGEVGAWQIRGNDEWKPTIAWMDDDGFHTHKGGYLIKIERD